MRTLAIGILAVLVVPATFAQDTKTEDKISGSTLIDKWIRAKWSDAQLKPAGKASEAEFMRRVYLDIVGEIPSLEEAESYLADHGSNKREKLVDTLLKDERYAEHWADIWSGVIVGFDKEQQTQGFRNEGAHDFRELLAKNLPYDEFARKVITAEGWVPDRYVPTMMMKPGEKPEEDKKPVGLASYMVRQFRGAGKDFPKAVAGKLTRAFLGVQIQCAQCHDHPFDRWTQEEFYGMASFFTEVRVKRDPKDAEMRGYHVEDAVHGGVGKKLAGIGGPDLSIPDSKTGPIKPSFIDTKEGAESGVARRASYAKYVTSPENLQFAKMCVNRYWSHFFGVGIVNPVDDFNGKNKPTHPELLNELAKDFIDHKYDLHWLIKALAGSEAYSLTSRSAAKERDLQAEKLYALGRVRALMPEQIMRSVIEAAHLDESPMMGMNPRDVKGPAGGKKKGGAKGDAAQALLMRLTAQFRTTFEDDEGGEAVEFAGTIPSALMMMNSQVIAAGTTAGRVNGFGEMLAKHPTPDAKVRAIFLSCVSRLPTPAEASRWMSHVTKGAGTAGYEDLMWTLLNTSEFLFNH
ncbi:MAG TPA: DUF1549 domain-containing protein [Planctomycetota bacterium]|nr:DUF1549 domain-containing protein [Planctomycetota bacterium]